MTTPYKSKEDNAIAVWLVLEQAQGQGRSLPELVEATGLTHYQVQNGIREINRVLQATKERPIMVKTEGWRYVLPEFYDEMLPWTVTRLRDILTRLRTEQKRFEAALAKWPNDVSRLIPRQIERLIEDLSDVMEHAGPAA
jgi:hypothetical protein